MTKLTKSEGKTDYYARKRLIAQDKDKYDSKKFRLVARKTNSKIIAQLIYATTEGDKVFCSAESTELKRFGLTAGCKNYSAGTFIRLILKLTALDIFWPEESLNKSSCKTYTRELKKPTVNSTTQVRNKTRKRELSEPFWTLA
jgi:ribosomal protein L18